MTVNIQIPPELEARVRDDAARQGRTGRRDYSAGFGACLSRDVVGRSRVSYERRETELLDKVSLGLTDEQWRRYWELRKKLEDSSLASPEHAELLAVNDRIERANAERMKYLVELAALRNVPLPLLMEELGLGNGAKARRAW